MKNQSVWKRLGFALNGLRCVYKSENSIVMYIVGVSLATAIMGYVNPDPRSWCIFVLSAAFILCVELINTAVEYFLDEFYPEYNETVGKVKDILSGAALVATLAALICFFLLVYTQT
ncbi:MAG: diacylglycerol kinase [Bdellovibrionota bacterium]